MRFRKLACLLVVVISPVLASATNTHVLSQGDGPITISGTVTGPGGSGVAGALVEASYPWGNASVGSTDAGGHYQVSIAPGPIWLTVRAPLASRLAGYFVNLGYQDADVTQDFQLEAGRLLSGLVVMPDGNAVQSGIEVVLHAFSFDAAGEDSPYLLKTRTTVAGAYDIVVPLGIYWAGVKPPDYFYSVEKPVDLRSVDVDGFVLTLSEELVDPIPVEPPDTSKITFGGIDELGEATVTGASGATLGLAHVLLVNLGSLHQADTISAADGSFSTRLFAPAGSVVLIKHGGLPASNWRDLAAGVSMDKSPFPGSIVHLPHTDSPDPSTLPFAVVGPGEHSVDFLPDSPNWVSTGYVFSGRLSPSGPIDPGDQITIDGTLRVYGPAIDSSTELGELLFSGQIGLWMLSGANGAPVAGNSFGMSTWLTPTGFPIQGISGPGRSAGISFSVSEFASSGEHSVEAEVEISGQLPADLQQGLYRPFLFTSLGGFPLSTDWTAAEVFSNPFEPPMAALPPIEVSAGGEEPRRLIWRLLMENPVQGARGIGAIEDRGTFEFSQFITYQGAPYIIPPVDRYGEPIRYRMEPYLPRISFADRRIPARPLIPFQLPGGNLNVIIEEPDGGVRDLGSAEFARSLSRTVTTRAGREINPGTTQFNDTYSLTTGDERFRVTFDTFGRHFVLMNGVVEDLWGSTYSGGGAYEVWVAHPLDMDPGVLPGTPLEVGDSFNPTLQVFPRVPAEVSLTVTHYPASDPALATTQVISGACNAYGFFSGSGETVTFDSPGEVRVDLTVWHMTEADELYMGAITWGGVVMTPASEAELVAHGRRGLDSLEEIPHQSWFVSARDLDIPAGVVSHTYNPYYNGDMLWTRFEDESGIVDGGDSLILGASVQDLVGDIEQAIDARAEVMHPEMSSPGSFDERIEAGEIPLFSSTTTGFSPLLAPQDVDQIAYAYRSSQRPGVRVREMVGEDIQNGGYWRLDTVYDGQLGVGVLGDQPNDFKFQYLGVVYRDLVTGHNEYLGHGSGWIFIPDDDPVSSRAMPPFAGPGNGGWTTEGGPLLTLKGQDIDIFILPTGTRPGAVLEAGDTFHFAGHLMPTLASNVAVTLTSPGGAEYSLGGQANRVGYYFDPSGGVIVDEPGAWSVDVQVWHDGLCSGGATVSPYPHGDVLGSEDGRYWVYVVEPGHPRLEIDSPQPGYLSIGGTVHPVSIEGRVPAGLDSAVVAYTISMPGFILDQGEVEVEGRRYEIKYDPVTLSQDFPNLDLTGRDENWPGLSDTVTVGLLLRGETGGAIEYRANTVTLQGQQVFVGGDGQGFIDRWTPRLPDGRSGP